MLWWKKRKEEPVKESAAAPFDWERELKRREMEARLQTLDDVAKRLCDVENVPEHVKFVIDRLKKGKYFHPEKVELRLANEKQADAILLYTHNYRYTIAVIPRDLNADGGLLGYMSTRTPRPGETWNRGNDLADGPLTEETLTKIILDILSNELLHVEADIAGCPPATDKKVHANV